jgi:hypothetical protein
MPSPPHYLLPKSLPDICVKLHSAVFLFPTPHCFIAVSIAFLLATVPTGNVVATLQRYAQSWSGETELWECHLNPGSQGWAGDIDGPSITPCWGAVPVKLFLPHMGLWDMSSAGLEGWTQVRISQGQHNLSPPHCPLHTVPELGQFSFWPRSLQWLVPDCGVIGLEVVGHEAEFSPRMQFPRYPPLRGDPRVFSVCVQGGQSRGKALPERVCLGTQLCMWV